MACIPTIRLAGRLQRKAIPIFYMVVCRSIPADLLKECPSENSKSAGLGGVILATFVLAALSSGYAVYSVFDNLLWAVMFGIIWGLIILISTVFLFQRCVNMG